MRPLYTLIHQQAQVMADLCTSRIRYWLELDNKDNILGGSYTSWLRTDFTWMLAEVPPFSGYFTDVAAIYKASIGNRGTHSIEARREGTNRAKLGSRSLDCIFSSVFSSAHAHAVTLMTEAIPSRRIGEHMTAISGTIVVKNYASNEHKGWSIVPPGQAKSIVVSVKEFSTERHQDKVRIYEGEHGEGALVAVLHGKVDPRDVEVHSPSAFISFMADADYSGDGFVLHWTANY